MAVLSGEVVRGKSWRGIETILMWKGRWGDVLELLVT